MHARAACWVPAILLVAAAGCSGMQQQEQAKPMVDQAAISARIDSFATVWSGAVTGKDTTAIASMYAEDAHVLPPNAKRIDGRDAIRHMWAGMFAMPGFDLKTVSNTKIVSEAGDLVVDLGTYEFSGTTPKGKPWHDSGKYAAVFKNVSGEWKEVAVAYNSDLPIPGM